MPGNDFALVALAETTRRYVQTEEVVEVREVRGRRVENGKEHKRSEKTEKKTLLRRLPSVRSTLSCKFGRLRSSFGSVNCFKTEDAEKMPFENANVPKARKSIDIGVGLARRMSLFYIFTKKAECAHPYHPYYPEQTTRKIYIYHDDS